MARIAKKKTVDNGLGLLNVVEGVDKKKVVSVTDFGSFFIVLLKDGAIYHTHIGYEVRCKRWVMDVTGKDSKESLLYLWLANLVEFKEGMAGKEDEPFKALAEAEVSSDGELKGVGEDVTNGDMLEYAKAITAANMLHPVSAFADMNVAAKFANERLVYLREMADKLEETYQAGVKAEEEEALRKNYEEGEKAVMKEKVAKQMEAATDGQG